MKKLVAIVLSLLLVFGMSSAMAAEKIVIAASSSPHAELLEEIRDDYLALGYEMEIVEFIDYPLFNPALADGETDANFFQHLSYLEDYNSSVADDQKLVPAIAVHYEPYCIYPGKTKTIDELPEGGVIAIPNDATNETRALMLLQAAGIITLPEDAQPSDLLTVLDIVDNPRNVTILEIDASQLPATLTDADMAVINGNYAISAGLSPEKDAIFVESGDSETGAFYTNYVVVRQEDADAEWLKALEQVLCSEKIYTFIVENEKYAGGVIPVFEVETAEAAN